MEVRAARRFVSTLLTLFYLLAIGALPRSAPAAWIQENGCSVWSGTSTTLIASKWNGACGQSPSDPDIKNARSGPGELWQISKKGSSIRISYTKHSNYGNSDDAMTDGFSRAAATASNSLPEWEDFTACATVQKIVGGVEFSSMSCVNQPAEFLVIARRLYQTEWRQAVSVAQAQSFGTSHVFQSRAEPVVSPNASSVSISNQDQRSCKDAVDRMDADRGQSISDSYKRIDTAGQDFRLRTELTIAHARLLKEFNATVLNYLEKAPICRTVSTGLIEQRKSMLAAQDSVIDQAQRNFAYSQKLKGCRDGKPYLPDNTCQ